MTRRLHSGTFAIDDCLCNKTTRMNTDSKEFVLFSISRCQIPFPNHKIISFLLLKRWNRQSKVTSVNRKIWKIYRRNRFGQGPAQFATFLFVTPNWFGTGFCWEFGVRQPKLGLGWLNASLEVHPSVQSKNPNRTSFRAVVLWSPFAVLDCGVASVYVWLSWCFFSGYYIFVSFTGNHYVRDGCRLNGWMNKNVLGAFEIVQQVSMPTTLLNESALQLINSCS